MLGLDAVSVPPASVIVLNAIIKDEKVGLPDLIEVATPRDVARLKYDYVHEAIL